MRALESRDADLDLTVYLQALQRRHAMWAAAVTQITPRIHLLKPWLYADTVFVCGQLPPGKKRRFPKSSHFIPAYPYIIL